MSESAHRIMMNIFLLTPLREGRRHTPPDIDNNVSISTHAPAGGATITMYGDIYEQQPFLLTPLREGRPRRFPAARQRTHFYSRPCGRGDPFCEKPLAFVYDFYSRPCGRGDIKKQPGTVLKSKFLLTPLREGRLQ